MASSCPKPDAGVPARRGSLQAGARSVWNVSSPSCVRGPSKAVWLALLTPERPLSMCRPSPLCFHLVPPSAPRIREPDVTPLPQFCTLVVSYKAQTRLSPTYVVSLASRATLHWWVSDGKAAWSYVPGLWHGNVPADDHLFLEQSQVRPRRRQSRRHSRSQEDEAEPKGLVYSNLRAVAAPGVGVTAEEGRCRGAGRRGHIKRASGIEFSQSA